ncbi:hypothetical protein ACFYWS_20690 [Streptomyces sp. NPDC002795]|uniref:hypothetical protein n=1 Tax=Streptomyces sp. NPDC002795 TaxID=3364665 RepID=UPI0036816BF6
MDEYRDLIARLTAEPATTRQEDAAVWLLDTHGHWLPRLVAAGFLTDSADGPGIHWRNTAAACLGAFEGRMDGSEADWQILRLALALTGRHVMSLSDLALLEGTARKQAVIAFAWAAGGRAYADNLLFA